MSSSTSNIPQASYGASAYKYPTNFASSPFNPKSSYINPNYSIANQYTKSNCIPSIPNISNFIKKN